MPHFVVALDRAVPEIDQLGGKAASLARLAAAHLPVPPGFVLTTAAYRRFVADNALQPRIVAAAEVASDDPATLDAAAERIRALFEAAVMPADLAAAIDAAYTELGADVPVAVRSSATAEDLPDLSFAGQQETYLNVHGSADVRDAVRRCWASLWTARAIGYRRRSQIAADEAALAVVVQVLVPADAAGVMFTANPISGARDEILVNAAWGLGEAIVSGQVTPDALVLDKSSGTLRQYDVADKTVMTVRAAAGTGEEAVPEALRRAPALTDPQAARLGQLGVQIERLYGQPMDIEWALHRGEVAIVQARPITALPAPPAAPVAWTLPNPRGHYARSSVIELLPDPVTPLFATLGLPAWSRAMGALLETVQLAGLLPMETLVTINGYAYYDITTSIDSLRLIGRVPRLLAEVNHLIGEAQPRWANEAHPEYQLAVTRWADVDLAATGSTELLAGIHELVRAAADHYLAIQSGILPAAYMSEALFTLIYDRLLKRAADPPALTFMLGFDSAPIRAEKSLFDVAAWAQQDPELVAYLRRTPSLELAAALDRAAAPPVAGWAAFRDRFAAHLDQYGHAIYDLDFAKPLPRDEPAPLLEALKFFLSGRATSPYARQTAAARAREDATRELERRLPRPVRGLLSGTLRRAQRFAPLREDALADVGLGWPTVRRMLGELGRRLVDLDVLADGEDVYFLRLPELRVALASATGDLRPLIAGRRAAWTRERRAVPPSALPIEGGATFMGLDFSRWMPARTEQAAGDVIRGIGASPGRVTAPARVIGGPTEFAVMQPGDVLVARITTPAWTPLFALAAGVVTDVGGPLSHSSIVAREYHIPAVLGTGVATARLHGGQRITVDGDAGTVAPA